jgi:hypothetical protein
MIAAALAAYITAQAPQPPDCLPIGLYLSKYKAQFGESPLWRGITEDGKAIILQLYNPRTGTWTIALMKPDGVACSILSGKQTIPAPSPNDFKPGQNVNAGR